MAAWYLGEQGFKDKLLGLMDKAGARIRDRGNLAGAALRAHDEKEAERIIRIVGAVIELPGSAAERSAWKTFMPEVSRVRGDGRLIRSRGRVGISARAPTG